jgi:hypothetical protein
MAEALVTSFPPSKADPAMSEPFDPYRKWLGIPLADQPPNHYRLLGIAPFEDDPDVIDNAANRQRAHVRTFQGGKHAAASQKIMTELSAAKVCLLDPALKADYDAALRASLAADMPAEAAELSFPLVRPGGKSRWQPPGGSEVSGAPGPVPIPGVSAAGIARPAFAATRRPVAVRGKRKKSSLPLIITVICVLAIVALGAGYAIYTSRLNDAIAHQAEPSSAGNPRILRETPTKSLPWKAPKSNASNADNRLRDETPFQIGGGESAEPDRDPLPRPMAPTAVDGGEIDRLNQALYLAEQALRSRDEAAFHEHIAAAEQLLGENEKSETARQREKLEDLRALKTLVDEFWIQVRDNVHNKIRLGERIGSDKHRFTLQRREGDFIEYTFDETPQDGMIGELPPKVAAVAASIAAQSKEPKSLLPSAAFLAIDSQAGGDEHQQARQFFERARDAGALHPPLARLLRLPAETPVPVEEKP